MKEICSGFEVSRVYIHCVTTAAVHTCRGGGGVAGVLDGTPPKSF